MIYLFIGSMYSGKTTAICRMLKERGGDLLIKHNIGHNRGIDITPVIASSVKDIKLIIEAQNPTILAIDEGHFFCGLADLLREFDKADNKHIFISALNSDFRQQPFEETSRLLAIAGDITYMRESHCDVCGKVGHCFNYRINDDPATSPGQQLNADDKIYTVRCKTCTH